MFRDLVLEGREIATGRLQQGQSLPDVLDVTAESLSAAIIASEASAPIGDWKSAAEMLVHALADVWTQQAS